MTWKIDAETRICASLANPNRKTTAPIMHNAGFEAVGANLRYFALEPTDIGSAMAAIRALGFVGVSVSKPFKEKVIQYLDEIDDTARRIGAVNVVHNIDGILKGYNSDWIGAIGALEEQVELEGQVVAVLGAGGAARAVAFGLVLRGAEVHIFNRTEERGSRLSSEIGVNWGGPLENAEELKANIVVNATPVGRQDAEVAPVGRKAIERADVVMDINVQKGMSKLLADAASSGAKTIAGVRMLVLQGVFAFELFSGKTAPIDVMQAAVIAALK